MCGIAGIVRPQQPLGVHRVAAAMATALASRGPDGEGVWSDEVVGVAVSHRRLAVIDTSPTGAQPMSSADGRYVVVLNGEIYDHRMLRAELGDRPYSGHGDTATLVEAIAAWGVERSVARTCGMFAVAVWDTVDRRLTLVRDRLGEKPLYWTVQNGIVAFASQPSALRRVPGITLEVDPLAATALLRRSFVPHPWTIHRDVRQVPPGGLVEIDVAGEGRLCVTERTWWSLTDTLRSARANGLEVPLDAATELVDDAVGRAVAVRLESDVPLGAFLSGGVDSSIVASHAQRALGERRLRTFTVAMPDEGFDESHHAERVARHLGTDHTTVALTTADVLDVIPHLATVHDEPFADPSMLPTALLMATAARQLTVALSGDGGDELFAGYNRHAAGAVWARRFGALPGPVRSATSAVLRSVPPRVVDGAARILPASRRPPNLGDKVHKLGALAGSSDFTWDALAATWPTLHLGAHHDVVRPDLVGWEPVEQWVALDTASVLPDDMLVKVDRASMAAGLEVRVPLLDPELVSLAWRLPTQHKVVDGIGKIVLRSAARRHLPDDLAHRPKMGFDPPLGRWLRTELRPWADDLLNRPTCVERGWLDGAALRRTWDEHRRGTANHEYRLWAVLMLENWLHQVEGPARLLS
jgi:asparagine synthase (glutamine-hydrolysing)